MYQSNFISRWQTPLRSALYILLIVTMLWLPSPMDVSASTPSDEVPLLTSICEEEDSDVACANRKLDSQIPRCSDGMYPNIIGINIAGEPIWRCEPFSSPSPTLSPPPGIGQGGH